MATNKRSLGRRFEAYLGSNQNLAGSALAVAGAGAVIALHVPPVLVPVIAVGAYVAGALLAPVRRKGVFLDPSGASDRAQALRVEFDAFKATYRGELSKKLPREVHDMVARIMEKIEFIVNRLCEEESVEFDQTLVVSRTLSDYLPTSLETYAGLPHQFRTYRRDKVTGTTAHEELMSQLETLEERMTEALEAVLAGDVQALRNQGRFLEAKFHRSDLDLDGAELGLGTNKPSRGTDSRRSSLDLDADTPKGSSDGQGTDGGPTS